MNPNSNLNTTVFNHYRPIKVDVDVNECSIRFIFLINRHVFILLTK